MEDTTNVITLAPRKLLRLLLLVEREGVAAKVLTHFKRVTNAKS